MFFSTAQPFPPCSTSQPLKPSVGFNGVEHKKFARQLAQQRASHHLTCSALQFLPPRGLHPWPHPTTMFPSHSQHCPPTQLPPSLTRPRPLFRLSSVSNRWAFILALLRVPPPLFPTNCQFSSRQSLSTVLYFYASSVPAGAQ